VYLGGGGEFILGFDSSTIVLTVQVNLLKGNENKNR
jgi:hypothetical protein